MGKTSRRWASLRNACPEHDHFLLQVQGYFAMSQARHAMGGPGHVSSVQYDSGMKSLVRIHLSEDSGGIDPLPTTPRSCTEFKVQRLKPGEIGVERAEDEVPSGDTVRRRKGEESIEDVPLGKSKEVKEELKDPIKWFGILVPQSLRQAQQHFVQGECKGVLYSSCSVISFSVIQHSVELAAAQTRMVAAHRRYQELLAKKRELVQEQ